jgi:hypothetical protein
VFDARTKLAAIWRRLRAKRVPITEITQPETRLLPPPSRPVASVSRYPLHSPVEPYSWDAETRQ